MILVMSVVILSQVVLVNNCMDPFDLFIVPVVYYSALRIPLRGAKWTVQEEFMISCIVPLHGRGSRSENSTVGTVSGHVSLEGCLPGKHKG